MTKRVLCHSCLFGFTGDVLCTHCLSAYALVFESGGPLVGQTARLLFIGKFETGVGIDGKTRGSFVKQSKPTETRIAILGNGTSLEVDGVTVEFPHYETAGVKCPGCCSASLKFDFNNDDSCPRCGSKNISAGGIIE